MSKSAKFGYGVRGLKQSWREFLSKESEIHDMTFIPDKERTWKDIMRLTGDESGYIRGKAADTLVSIFPDMPNKEIVWIDFLSLIRAEDEYVRNRVANALKLVFPYLGKKDFAWKELIELAGDKNEYVRRTAAETLSKVFPHMADKNEAYSDLANLAKKSVNYRLRELATLAADYPQLFYNYDSRGRKLEEMKENIELRDGTKIDEEKLIGVKELSSERFVNLPEEAVLSYNSDKKQYNWSGVLKLAEARDTKVRRHTADLLARIFSDVKTRPGVFFDLVKLTESQDAHIRKKAAELFPVAFEYSDEKQKVWDELVRLTSAVDRVVRREAVLALSSGYAEVSDKDKAWKDLVRLSDYRDNFVKRVATRALGNAFFYVIDKTEAWRDLEKVQANSYIFVRKYAFRSLGIASLWKSLRAENEVTYIFGIKEAIKFFIEADEISTDTNIPDFYQPFYETLLSVLFSEIPNITKIESERYVSRLSNEVWTFGDSQPFHDILDQLEELLKKAGELTPGDLLAQKKLLETSIQTFEKFSSFFEIKEEEAILSAKIEKKGYPKPERKIWDLLIG